MIDREAIGERVREARKLSEYTQENLAIEAGVTTETISRLERGLYDPSLATILAVANAVGQSVEWLITGLSPVMIRTATESKIRACVAVMKPDHARALLRIAEAIVR